MKCGDSLVDFVKERDFLDIDLIECVANSFGNILFPFNISDNIFEIIHTINTEARVMAFFRHFVFIQYIDDFFDSAVREAEILTYFVNDTLVGYGNGFLIVGIGINHAKNIKKLLHDWQATI